MRWKKLAKAAVKAGLLADAEQGEQTEAFTPRPSNVQLGKPFDDADRFKPFNRLARRIANSRLPSGVFLWPRQTGPKGDLVDDEMGRVLQVPGWSNIFTQPIINRIEMLSTGVRTDIGVKVFGPDLGHDRSGLQGYRSGAEADQRRPRRRSPRRSWARAICRSTSTAKRAARYGISVEDIQNEIEVALAGRAVTYTVEKRDRFPVRIRYARVRARRRREHPPTADQPPAAWLGRRSMSAGGTGMARRRRDGRRRQLRRRPRCPTAEAAHSATPAHAGTGKTLIPLGRRGRRSRSSKARR